MQLVKFLDWDSNFFGINVGVVKIAQNKLGREFLDRALLEARAKKINCLYLEIPSPSGEILDYCTENKFTLADFRVILSKELSKKKKIISDMLTYKLQDEDYPYLKKIADLISRYSRFANDSRFGLKWSRKLYQEWLKKSFYGKFCDDFIIYKIDKKPVGFITLRFKDSVHFIDLIGVAGNKQKRGIGGILIDDAERRLFEQGQRLLKVATPGTNIKALRLYQNKDFKIEKTNFFYHKWLD